MPAKGLPLLFLYFASRLRRLTTHTNAPPPTPGALPPLPLLSQVEWHNPDDPTKGFKHRFLSPTDYAI